MTPAMKRAEEAYNHEIRVEHFIDLASEAALAETASRLPEALEDEFLTDMAHSTRHDSVGRLMDYLHRHGTDDEDVLEALAMMPQVAPGLLGVVINVATPVRKGPGGHYSWAHCTLEWIWAPTYEEAWAKAVEWAKHIADNPRED